MLGFRPKANAFGRLYHRELQSRGNQYKTHDSSIRASLSYTRQIVQNHFCCTELNTQLYMLLQVIGVEKFALVYICSVKTLRWHYLSLIHI